MTDAPPSPVPGSSPSGSVLVVGPGVRGRGGIASVIRTHAQTETWHRRGLRHLSTFDDRSPLHKAWSALAAYAAAPVLLWRARMVHIHLAAQTSILRKLPIVALARLLGRRVIVHFHAPSEASIFEHTPAGPRASSSPPPPASSPSQKAGPPSSAPTTPALPSWSSPTPSQTPPPPPIPPPPRASSSSPAS